MGHTPRLAGQDVILVVPQVHGANRWRACGAQRVGPSSIKRAASQASAGGAGIGPLLRTHKDTSE